MNQYKILVNSLKLLSLSYEKQRYFLPDFVGDDVIQDDVVSEFCDAIRLLPQLMDRHEVSYLTVNIILRCYLWVDDNVFDDSLTVESFKNGEKWNRVRRLAREALKEMGEALTPPEDW